MKHVVIHESAMEVFKDMPFADGLRSLWDYILVEDGKPTLVESTGPIRPGDYGMDKKQVLELLKAWQEDPDDAVFVALTWCDVGPSTVDV